MSEVERLTSELRAAEVWQLWKERDLRAAKLRVRTARESLAALEGGAA